MIVPYFVIECARFGDRARHVLFKEVGLARQVKLGLFKAPDEPQKCTTDIHPIYVHLGSADGYFKL